MELHVLSARLFGFHLHKAAKRHLADHFIPHEGNNHKPHVLHHRALFLYTCLILLLKAAVISAPVLLPLSIVQSSAITPENIISLTNQSRADAGLVELTYNPKLTVAAQLKARDMMDQHYFAHFSPSGVSPWYWFAMAGYDYRFAGENLAIRFSTAEGVNGAWLASPAHRANILSENFSEIGVAVLTDTYGDEGEVTIVVQLFGMPSTTTSPASAEPQAAQTQKAAEPGKPHPSLSEVYPRNPEAQAEILFPLPDSYVNIPDFTVIGSAVFGDTASVYIDSAHAGTARISSMRFELPLDSSAPLEQGEHTVSAIIRDGEGRDLYSAAPVRFRLDTEPPTIVQDSFRLAVANDSAKEYEISVSVSTDTVRAIVVAGRDSTSLTPGQEAWTGKLTIFQTVKDEPIPIEVIVQDLAGNESRTRVGSFSHGSVRGVFNFTSGETQPAHELSVFNGLFKINNLESFVKMFYLYFSLFLASALLLKIAIKRHIQHPRTIAGSALVIMLAVTMFAV